MNVLLERLTRAFGPPAHVKDLPGFVAEMELQTAGFGVEALDRAAAGLIRHGGKGWPSPRAIVDACVEAQQDLASARRSTATLPVPRKKWPWELDAERAEAWAREYVAQSRWQLAHDEGWERSLRLWAQSYAREHYRRAAEPDKTARPSQAEVDYWQRYGRAPTRQEAADELSDGEFVDRVADGSLELRGPFAGYLRRMARLMQERRQEEPAW